MENIYIKQYENFIKTEKKKKNYNKYKYIPYNNNNYNNNYIFLDNIKDLHPFNLIKQNFKKSNWKELPLRQNLPKNFKCQRNYYICNNFVSKYDI